MSSPFLDQRGGFSRGHSVQQVFISHIRVKDSNMDSISDHSFLTINVVLLVEGCPTGGGGVQF